MLTITLQKAIINRNRHPFHNTPKIGHTTIYGFVVDDKTLCITNESLKNRVIFMIYNNLMAN